MYPFNIKHNNMVETTKLYTYIFLTWTKATLEGSTWVYPRPTNHGWPANWVKLYIATSSGEKGPP